MARLLSTNWALNGLSSHYQDDDEEGFIECYGCTFKELELANKKLILKLIK